MTQPITLEVEKYLDIYISYVIVAFHLVEGKIELIVDLIRLHRFGYLSHSVEKHTYTFTNSIEKYFVK